MFLRSYRRLCALVFGLTVVTASAASAQLTFAPPALYATGSQTQGLAVADFNHDGHQDLAVSSFGAAVVRIRLGDGTGALGPATDFPAGGLILNIATGDFNGDSHTDLVAANNAGNTVSVLLGNGSGSFGAPVSFPAAHPDRIVVGLFDANAALDLAVTSSDGDVITILLGDGAGSFTPAVGSPIGGLTDVVAIAAGDASGDLLPDLVVASFSTNLVTILVNDGNAGFSELSSVAVSAGPIDVVLVDLNKDDYLDLVVSAIGSSVLNTAFGNEDGGFGGMVSAAAGGPPRRLTIGDFNNDGKVDVAAAIANGNSISVLAGDGINGLGAPQSFPSASTQAAFMATSDFNEDGRPDLVVGDLVSQDSSVLLNTSCCIVTVIKAGSGSGSVVSAPAGIDCGSDCAHFFGAGVTLFAIPAAGSLASLTGGVCGGADACAFTVAGDVTITATFTPVVSTLSPTTLPDAAVGVAYSQDLTISSTGTGPFGVLSDTLPVGLEVAMDELNPLLVHLTGVPAQGGLLPFTISVTDYATGGATSSPYTLNILPASTSTTTVPASATFNDNAQSIPLSATITGPIEVNGSTVTFTVRNAGSVVVGSPVTSAAVSAGTATANYLLPGGTSVQALTITAVYNTSATFTTSLGTAALTVSQAASTTTAVDATTTFSDSTQIVPLSAVLTSGQGVVNGGTVTFTVRDSGNVVIGSPVTSGAVLNGAATAAFTLPAAVAVQALTVTADFSGSTNFVGSIDTATLTVGRAATVTTPANATTTFNLSSQIVPLSAAVTSARGVVNSGAVTFTVRDSSSVVIGSPVTSGTVVNGAAAATYTLPGGTPGQALTITAVYQSSPTFADSVGTAPLTVGPTASATTTTDAATIFSDSNQAVPLSAAVTSGQGVVNGGAVTFTIRNSSSVVIGSPVTSGTVVNGAAAATYILPGGTSAQALTITAAYGSSPTFADSLATAALTVSRATSATTAASTTASFSESNQIVPLSAAVTSGQGLVNGGTVTFTVRDSGAGVIGSPATSGAVVNGAATAAYTLPRAVTVQTLTVTAVFNGSTDFTPSTGTAVLSVGCPAMTPLPAELPVLNLGSPFSQTFTVSGVTDATFALTGTLPPGLTFSGATLSGTPTGLGRSDITITASSAGAGGCSASRDYALSVVRGAVLTVGPGSGVPNVRTFDTQAALTRSFLADTATAGGSRVASGDVNGDGHADIITAAGPGAGSATVRVFNGNTGTLMRQFLAYPSNSPGGVHVAAGDVNSDGFADIVTGRDNALPEVKVFDGRTGAVIGDFLAYEPNVVDGVRVAVGDMDADGFAEIITAPPPGAGPVIRVFTPGGVQLTAFFAYTPGFWGGVFVAAGDVDGDGFADIVTGADAGGGPHVNAFSGRDLHVLRSFFAYSAAFPGGVRVAASDLNNDGMAEIVTAAGAGGGPHVRVWDGASGSEILGFFAYDGSFSGGVFVSAPTQLSRMSVDTPAPGSTVSAGFLVGGWALDSRATTDSGVDAIHVWAYPALGGAPVFLGAAAVRGARPDVAQAFGGIYRDSGFDLTAGPIAPGVYDLVVFVHSALTETFSDRRVVRVTVQ
jgi:fibronectin-binding autotransporter adhesin